VGRPKKKKSVKIKRSVIEIIAIIYLLYGIMVVFIRAYLRHKVKKNPLGMMANLKMLLTWPRFLIRTM